MPRPNEIAADARALYGPPSVRPAAGAMGDGALWVDPGDSQSLWQVQSGNWRQIALPPTDDDSSVPAGVPVLRGPYVVDYTDFGPAPMEGHTVDLWTSQAGDCLLRLFADVHTQIAWDQGRLFFGQNVDGGAGSNVFSSAPGLQLFQMEMTNTQNMSGLYDAPAAPTESHPVAGTAVLLRTTDPVQVQLAATGGTDPTQGHVDIFALIARAVAP